ncbi:MAG: hypothetical protein MZV64_37480 [Ignavibacteriales bacterium]|nr:hypothetical protein [Ignavibacteriales bacterium]
MKEISNIKGWRRHTQIILNISVYLHLFQQTIEDGDYGKKFHTLTITIYNRDAVYEQVSDLLHDYAEYILLRTGYPIKRKNIAIIFLIVGK